jgi:hypothetical protein
MSMTFLEAWRCRDSIAADGGSLRPWLLGIATLPANPQALLTVIAAKSAGQSADDLGALAVAGGAPTIAQMLASGHITADLRAHLATMTKAQRTQYIAQAESTRKHPAATPPRGTVMQEIVYAENTEVPGPGDR